MRVLLSFMPVSLMADMALPDEVDTSLGTLVKSARLTTRGEIGSRGSGKPTSFPGGLILTVYHPMGEMVLPCHCVCSGSALRDA